MKRADLGTLSGPVLLWGGALSNAQALAALLAWAGRSGIAARNMICTGDLVGYCADSIPVLETVRTGGLAVIAGNVERQLAAGAGDCGCGFAPGSACDQLSAGWFGHADRTVGACWRDWMAALPDVAVFAHHGRRYAVVHGGLTDISRFLWHSSAAAAFRAEITAITAACGPVDGVVAGHSGIAFTREIDGVAWINAGVIGMPPHDGRVQTRFATLTEDGVRICRLDYDHAGAAAAMRKAGLVQGYDQALETGFWPTEEVLPAEMR